MPDITLRPWKVGKMSNEKKWYKLVFKQNQPVHIGWFKWGVIKETALFIPGQTMWGALVYAYILQKQLKSEGEIEEVKNKFEILTNFFPTFDRQGNDFLEPKYENGEFYLGEFSEEKFRFLFVDSILQTAIEPILRKAKDESLHELDFILPKPKQKLENFNDSLYWVGLIKLHPNEVNNFLREGLKIFVGGDIKYGYGELELIKCEEINENLKEKWQIYETENEKITVYPNKNILHFINIDIFENHEVEGKIIPIPKFNFKENTPQMESCNLYLHIGGKIVAGSNPEGKLILGKIEKI